MQVDDVVKVDDKFQCPHCVTALGSLWGLKLHIKMKHPAKDQLEGAVRPNYSPPAATPAPKPKAKTAVVKVAKEPQPEEPEPARSADPSPALNFNFCPCCGTDINMVARALEVARKVKEHING